MSANTPLNRAVVQRAPDTCRAPLYDVTVRVKSWGRRGVLWGALFGFTLGATLVAIPLSTDILTFGVIGTLTVAAVECAVIAGGFAALAAALVGEGANGTAKQERTITSGRRTKADNWRDGRVPLAAWPDRWAYPVRTFGHIPPLGTDDGPNLPASLPDV